MSTPTEQADAAKCPHMDFAAEVNVGRITRGEDGPVTGYTADITIKCAACGKRFQFLGLQPGSDTHGARVSLDGLQARLAISPEGIEPNPFHRIAYDIKAFQ